MEKILKIKKKKLEEKINNHHPAVSRIISNKIKKKYFGGLFKDELLVEKIKQKYGRNFENYHDAIYWLNYFFITGKKIN